MPRWSHRCSRWFAPRDRRLLKIHLAYSLHGKATPQPQKALKIANSPNIGVCLCCGTWLKGGAAMDIDPVDAIRYSRPQKQILNCTSGMSALRYPISMRPVLTAQDLLERISGAAKA